MTDFKYEAQAKRGEPMPDGLDWSEQGAYQAVALLTARYRLGSVTADQAKTEMGYIRKCFSKSIEQEKFIYKMAKLRLDIELALCAFNKDETLDNAKKMRDVLTGMHRLTDDERKALAALL